MKTGKTWKRTWLAIGALCAVGAAAWAKPVNCRIELDRSVLPAQSKPQTAILKVTLDGVRPETVTERPPVNLTIVLDRSGSMSGAKLQRAKDAAIEAVSRLSARDVFSLVVYNQAVETVIPAQRVENVAAFEKRIRDISAGGNTALYGGVSQGAAEIRKHLGREYVHRVILLSDGLANVGPSSPEDLGRLGAGLIKEGISVTTVGVGTDYNEDLMARLSQASDGNTYFVENSQNLAQIFNAELGDVLSIVAKKVNITIECPDGVRPLRLVGRDGRIGDRSVEIYLNQLYGGQEKFALVEVEVPAGEAGESRELATATVTYSNPFTERSESASARAVGRFSKDAGDVASSVNVVVQRELQRNVAAEKQDQAISLADAGHNKEAANVLRESAQKMELLADELKDEALRREANELEQQADVLDSKGMNKRLRKTLRSDSYQTVNQQRSR